MKRYSPWLIAGFISFLGIIRSVFRVADTAALADFIFEIAFALNICLFSFMGALIVIRQRGNRVGWLMMLGAFAFANPFSFLLTFFPKPPSILTPGLWLLLWVQSWFSLLAIISIFLIVLHFPDGRPPSTRWNWLNTVAKSTLFLLALMSMFSEQLRSYTNAWAVDNPLGFLPSPALQGITSLTGLGVLILAGGSLTSIFLRFKQGGFLERQQIKWLFFAGGVFIFASGLLLTYWSTSSTAADISNSWQEFFSLISVLAFPVAIANAILRYRLYDIDIIIRRTLVYGALTATLALVYFGSVLLLESIFQALTGQSQSQVVTVISTLAIAALFTPLRRRIQNDIDRRFYRKKYDAEQALEAFALTVRQQVDLDEISASLLRVVQETMQPESITLWLKPPKSR